MRNVRRVLRRAKAEVSNKHIGNKKIPVLKQMKNLNSKERNVIVVNSKKANTS
jgi:hypothetical protein